MKSRILILSVVFALALSAVSPALAQTSTTTPSSVSQITELLAKVKQLQEQLAALQQQQKDVSTELRETVQLTRSLYRGLTGDDVKELQEILATDPTIYPERIVSGFFGPLTEQAVRRFQAKFGIASIGIVGPQTIAKIHSLLEGEDSIRPGLLMKAQNLTDKTNPAGVCRAELAAGPAEFVAKYGSNANRANAFGMCVRAAAQLMGDDEDEDEDEEEEDEDEDEEEDELEITDVDTEDITATSATITWMTNLSSTSKVYYSTEEDFDIDDDGVESEEDSDEVMEHEIELTGLEPDTTYYFIVVSENDDDDEMSSEESFETLEE